MSPTTTTLGRSAARRVRIDVRVRRDTRMSGMARRIAAGVRGVARYDGARGKHSPRRARRRCPAGAPVGTAPPETAMTLATDQLERLAIDTIRTLSIDGVQQANSGHPGAPMGMAPMAYALWTRHLRHAPTNPRLAEPRPVRAERRPRVDAPVLAAPPDRATAWSSTTSSQFRQWGSITPGHPEYGLTPGVEATTGPLGQGLAQRRRHGDRRAPARRSSSTAPATTSSTTGRT